jgi:DNA-binding CsgD family transcriptional regulator
VLIMVEPPQATAVPDEALRLRFGLTRTEVRVARLLAEGRSNDGIAAEFEISPHTARHHTQHVLQKLGVSSRAQVGPKIHSPGTRG